MILLEINNFFNYKESLSKIFLTIFFTWGKGGFLLREGGFI